MLRKFLGLILLLGFFALYSCTNGMKFPKYSGTAVTGQKASVNLPKVENVKKTKGAKGIYYLKIHKCSKAIRYFKSLGNGFIAKYCLLTAYGYCSKYKQAHSVFGRLESENVNNIWQARLYATYGFISMINGKDRYRDYITIAYAYDGNNKLAKQLMLKKSLNKYDKQKYFNEAFMWCAKDD